MDDDQDTWLNFYRKHKLNDKVVLDPFMGSGTTLGECAKLGIKPIGCDINPVSTFIVKQALTRVESRQLKATYEAIGRDVEPQIRQYYRTIDPQRGEACRALYYFWVKVVESPEGEKIPLFSNYVFSKNVYPKKKPLAQILCEKCWAVNQGRYNSTDFTCQVCRHTFNPQVGPARRQAVKDKAGRQYKIKKLVLANNTPPEHRLYAIMALTDDGKKVYQSPSEFDFELYQQASRELATRRLLLPNMMIREGYNTNQARGYNYLNWRDFFNDRQLLCLGILLERIMQIPDITIREHFLCLFSSTLEFNNMFCTSKEEPQVQYAICSQIIFSSRKKRP